MINSGQGKNFFSFAFRLAIYRRNRENGRKGEQKPNSRAERAGNDSGSDRTSKDRQPVQDQTEGKEKATATTLE